MKHRIFAITCGLTLLSCGKSDQSQETVPTVPLPVFDRQALLTQLANDVVKPRYQSFLEQSRVLETSIKQSCEQLALGSLWDAVKAPPQKAWQDTMRVWQEAEAFQFGPVADAAASLRYDIYVWPQVNTCLVDRQVATLAASPTGFQLSDNDGSKSLSALEYLLFDPDADHSCRSSLEDTKDWNEKAETMRHQFRCQYLGLLAKDLVQQADTLVTRWATFQEAWTAPASDQVLQERLNMVSDSLFFLDTTVKDRKLALPLGLIPDCTTPTCPDRAEHTTADFAIPALRANLKGFAAVYSGGAESALGFDDYLEAAGAGELAKQMQSDLEASLATAAELEDRGTFLSLLSQLNKESCLNTDRQQRLEPLCALYRDIKAVTDELKTEFVQILQLKVPAQSSGDND